MNLRECPQRPQAAGGRGLIEEASEAYKDASLCKPAERCAPDRSQAPLILVILCAGTRTVPLLAFHIKLNEEMCGMQKTFQDIPRPHQKDNFVIKKG